MTVERFHDSFSRNTHGKRRESCEDRSFRHVGSCGIPALVCSDPGDFDCLERWSYHNAMIEFEFSSSILIVGKLVVRYVWDPEVD